MGGADGGREVLAAGVDGTAESRGEGYFHRLRGRAERLSRSHRSRVSAHRSAALRCAPGTGFAELRALEAAPASGRRSAGDLSHRHRSQAEQHLAKLEAKWKAYPSVSQVWRRNWARITPFFNYPQDIRTAIYTTNSVESLNRSLRKIIKVRGGFPNEEAALKLLFLALRQAAKKWTMPIHHWREALNHFTILWPERMPDLERVASWHGHFYSDGQGKGRPSDVTPSQKQNQSRLHRRIDTLQPQRGRADLCAAAIVAIQNNSVYAFDELFSCTICALVVQLFSSLSLSKIV